MIKKQNNIYVCDLCNVEVEAMDFPSKWKVFGLFVKEAPGKEPKPSKDELDVCEKCASANGAVAHILKLFGYGK